jgi:glutamate/tyrosine decarboxylase-like PLP-dependent enzyme
MADHLRATIPKLGIDRKKILNDLSARKKDDCDFRGGRTFGLVYHVDQKHEDLLADVQKLFLEENYLNPMAFKSILGMELELVSMISEMCHGGSNAVGCVTSGGTESILLACKAYRNRARLKNRFRKVEMILPETAHVAFEKAAAYFGIAIKRIPVGKDYKADMKALERAITRNTALIVMSAPQYPHGVMDPIRAAAKIARKRNIPLHVDACMGGFVLPWLEKLGEPIEPWDFRVEGVTSISLDIHKYGYCPKGASALLYSSMGFMRNQFFVSTNWPGGVYASTTLQGSRPGHAIATAYASVVSLGEEGFLRLTKRILEAKKILLEAISDTPELVALGPPEVTCVAIASKDKNIGIYAVGDVLQERGWHLDRQQSPESLHLTIMQNHLDTISSFVKDLRDAVAIVRANPKLNQSGQAAVYGMMAKAPLRGFVKTNVAQYLADMYGSPGASSSESLGTLHSDSVKVSPILKMALKIFGKKSTLR